MYRKIETEISEHLLSNTPQILLIDGARQVGKTYIIRKIGQQLFDNFIEVNMTEDFERDKMFEKNLTVDEFYIRLSTIAGDKMDKKENTLIFLDEIQQYPHLLTLLKFLQQDDKFTYIASGSLLGITLSQTTSIPIGSVKKIKMYPLDFEEFLLANGFNHNAISSLESNFLSNHSLDENMHSKMLNLFKRYLLVGGLPGVVNTYLSTHNIHKVREIQREIREYYAADASKYDIEHRLKIKRIYEMIPSNLANKKKRMVVKEIEGKKGKTFANYQDEFDYLINAGIALDVKAVSTPVFPLPQVSEKNLLKLYLNDVGLLTEILYNDRINAILDDENSINLGSVYESVVASELYAHGFNLYYYDNRNRGEVDFLIDDYNTLSTLPLEIKSGKDYSIHSALTHFTENEDYHIQKGCVLSNNREIKKKGKILYLPIYFIMFFRKTGNGNMKF